MIYGSYPEIITTVGLSDKRDLLNNIVNGYLYNDSTKELKPIQDAGVWSRLGDGLRRGGRS